MERGTLPFVEAMLMQWCPVYELVSAGARIELLKAFYRIYSPLYKTYLNSVTFSTGVVDKYVIFFGQISTMTGPFYDNDTDPEYSWK
jgi:hypothetical protein